MVASEQKDVTTSFGAAYRLMTLRYEKEGKSTASTLREFALARLHWPKLTDEMCFCFPCADRGGGFRKPCLAYVKRESAGEAPAPHFGPTLQPISPL